MPTLPAPEGGCAFPRQPPPMPPRPRRLVFFGTPAVAVPFMDALVEAGYQIPLVVTRADKRRGRGSVTSPSPVKAAAQRHDLPVTHRIEGALEVGAEAGIVVAFGRLIRSPMLDELPLLNVHFSLLPRWRGAAPVERAILAGDDKTGVCLMQIEEELDAGPVFARSELEIRRDETADELRDRLVICGVELLLEALDRGLAEPVAQVGAPTHAAKIDPSELELDWSTPCIELLRVIRLGQAWTTHRGRRLKVIRAGPGDAGAGLAPGELDGTRVGTGDGALDLAEVQAEGRRRQPAEEWSRGARPRPGELLGP